MNWTHSGKCEEIMLDTLKKIALGSSSTQVKRWRIYSRTRSKENPRVSPKTRETLIILHDSSPKVFLMNALGTVGSPHRDCNTARLVEAVLEGARL